MYGAPGSEFDDIIRGMGRSLMIGKQTMQHESPSIAHVDGFQNVLIPDSEDERGIVWR
jgi:hypothetical protein